MDFDRICDQTSLFRVIVLAIVSSAEALALPTCSHMCGDVQVPYPFGTTKECALNSDFVLNCDTSTTPHTLSTGNLNVTMISLEGQLHVWMDVARKCYYQSGKLESSLCATLQLITYTASSKANKFVTVGCDTFGYLNSFQNGNLYSTGCLSRCKGNTPLPENLGNCSGVGCCQVDIPPGMNNISIEAYSFNNQSDVWDFNNCSYAFVVEQGWFNFSYDNLRYLPYKMVLMVFDWAIGIETCEIAQQNTITYACKGNRTCSNSPNGSGYLCACKNGFEGNPYLTDGCQDIDECEDDAMNNCLS
ncbi:Wall-associated receptor kinase-like protein [Quillaja saponaria]|uniref:Wall-associated receptor kinase-like protein n=1 Tax=Quillaja saponaria TaxID=32244 RepID=A0AAD7PS45_QUISA|nr:Wall-associated receptor kinase-like protein [Quillaja saponaria]